MTFSPDDLDAGPALQTERSWHALGAEDVWSALETGPEGLDPQEVERRLAEIGPNALDEGKHASPWRTLAAQFKNVLVVILLVAALVSAFLGHGLEAVSIAVIVGFAALLGFVQEFRAERALEALRAMAAPTARVRRRGGEVTVPAAELVPGDIIELSAGDRVPADLRLLEVHELSVDEAALTGESAAVDKTTAALDDPELAVADRTNLAYAGTSIRVGRGVGVVFATGMDTEFGRISHMVRRVETLRTPLQENLDRLGVQLGRGALVLVAVVVALGVARGLPWIDMLIFGIALAVAVVPEALPAVVTISLAIGVKRMARRNALVRRLPVVETLGSTSVICSDKTGTLTRNEMTVRRVVAAGEVFDVTGAGYSTDGRFERDGDAVEPSPAALELLRAALLCSDAEVHENDGRLEVVGDPTEAALVVAATKAGLDRDAEQRAHLRVDEIAFTSERKRMTTLHTAGDALLACTKGASDAVLDICTHIRGRDGDAPRVRGQSGNAPLDRAMRDQLNAVELDLASAGFRVLAVATKETAGKADAERDMTLLGLVAMMDPPRPEAQSAIATAASAGIRTVMITGDHPRTARAIADELGLREGERVVTGRDLDALDDTRLERDVPGIGVFARVSPAHKLRVVDAWQRRGEVVAMTGDGVNDAPALKRADVGVAMGIIGTDVSREAAAVTLLDDNFATIVAAVEEGRIVFANIRKYLTYLLSSNVGEILLMLGAVLFGMPFPLTAVQILYVNLATDGLPALALAVDPPEEDLMRRRPRERSRGVFSASTVRLLAVGGFASAALNLGLFAWLLAAGRSLEHAMSMTFVSLVLIQFAKAYAFRSTESSILRRPFANRWLNLAVLWELGLLAAIVYVPLLQSMFGTHALSGSDWVLATGVSLAVLPLIELAKWFERRAARAERS